MKSGQIGGYTVQLGAGWLTGGGVDDPVFKLADQTQLVRRTSDYEDVIVLNATGTDVTGFTKYLFLLFSGMTVAKYV